jgi:hypothetical protein
VAALVEALKVRQIKRDALAGALAAREAVDVGRFDKKAIVAAVNERVGRWRALLKNHVEDGRQLLREVLAGPLMFTPEQRSYRFEGEAAIGRAFAGMAGLPTLESSLLQASWNHIVPWLRQIDGLRCAA